MAVAAPILPPAPAELAVPDEVTVVPGVVRRDDLGTAFQRLPPSPLPVLVLARMGVSTPRQRTGLGERPLAKVLSLAASLSRDVGCVGVVVDAKHEARGFYERFDFVWLPNQASTDDLPGVLPIGTIEAALG
jgi:GNAT superfamily N-acetyltransferase